MQFDYIISKEPKEIDCKQQIIIGNFSWIQKIDLRKYRINIHRVFGSIREQNNSSIEESSGIALLSKAEKEDSKSWLIDYMLFGHIVRREINVLDNNRIVIGSSKICEYINELISKTEYSLEKVIEEMKNYFWLKSECTEYSQTEDDIEVLNKELKVIGWISKIDIEKNIVDVYSYKIYYTDNGIKIVGPGQIMGNGNLIGIEESEELAMDEVIFYKSIGINEIKEILSGVYRKEWFKCVIPSYLEYYNKG